MDEQSDIGNVIGSWRHEPRNTNATPLVFVSGLWEQISERDLRELFAAYGNVRSVKLAERADACFSGYALIEMESSQKAAEANQRLNNVEFRGRNLCTVHVQSDELLERLVGIPSAQDVTATLQCGPRD